MKKPLNANDPLDLEIIDAIHDPNVSAARLAALLLSRYINRQTEEGKAPEEGPWAGFGPFIHEKLNMEHGNLQAHEVWEQYV